MRLSVRRPGALALMAALALVLRGVVAHAQDAPVRIGLTYAPGTKPGVLVLPVNGEQGDSVRAILQRDLDFGDRVNVIATESVIDTSTEPSRGQFNYPLYSRLGAAAMVQGTLTSTGLHVAVHDVRTQKVERVKDFPLAAAPLSPDWRQQLHAIADAVELWLTGVRGIASSRILYSSGGRIWQVDSDGANPLPLTGASPEARYPAWHPKATHVAYTLMTDDGTRVWVKEMGANGNGATRPLVPRVPVGSMNSSPVFSPDGNTVLYAHGLENGIDIYSVPAFANEPPRRVTVSRGFNAVSPAYSPDGRRIVYVSDKAGGTALYVSDADGTNAEALTPFNYGDRTQRSDPSWSPDGRFIAFQAEMDGATQIYTVRPGGDRGTPRQYTNEGRNEDPSWSPDSRHVVFTSNRSGSWQLWVLDIETGRPRQLTRAASGARHGAWSPRLIVH